MLQFPTSACSFLYYTVYIVVILYLACLSCCCALSISGCLFTNWVIVNGALENKISFETNLPVQRRHWKHFPCARNRVGSCNMWGFILNTFFIFQATPQMKVTWCEVWGMSWPLTPSLIIPSHVTYFDHGVASSVCHRKVLFRVTMQSLSSSVNSGKNLFGISLWNLSELSP
jgi:hypothetical protein